MESKYSILNLNQYSVTISEIKTVKTSTNKTVQLKPKQIYYVNSPESIEILSTNDKIPDNIKNVILSFWSVTTEESQITPITDENTNSVKKLSKKANDTTVEDLVKTITSITNLTENSVSILSQQYYIDEENGINEEIEGKVRKAYCNSPKGRIELESEVDNSIYSSIISIWGETPTVEDVPLEVYYENGNLYIDADGNVVG